MRARLSRVVGGTALRTGIVEGECDTPAFGEPFRLLGEPLNPLASVRVVTTSPITGLSFHVETRAWQFSTESGSVYRLEELGKEGLN